MHQSSDLYGSDRVLLEIADALRRSGGQPVVILPGDGPLVKALRKRGVETHNVEPDMVLKLSRGMFSPRGMMKLLAAVPRSIAMIDRALDGRSVQWVHSNTLAVLGGAIWSQRRRVDHLWHVHEIIEHPVVAAHALPWLVRLMSDRVVCNSGATRDWLVGSQPKLAGRTSVIWNGISSPSESDAKTPSIYRLYEDFRPNFAKHAIGLVGRINRWKGQDLLLEAAEILHAQGRRDFSVVFIGSAPPGQAHFESQLRERVARSPFGSNVVITGFMEDVSTAYPLLDIVCVPSTEPEPFGLVAIEAMAARRAVVAACIGGLPEIVVHGDTGFLHKPANAEDLARHLATLLDDEGLRQNAGLAGRARFEAEFTVEAMTRRFLDLLHPFRSAHASGDAR